jgi:hypothetical protein
MQQKALSANETSSFLAKCFGLTSEQTEVRDLLVADGWQKDDAVRQVSGADADTLEVLKNGVSSQVAN